MTRSAVLPVSEEALVEEVAALPARPPLMMMPMVAAPVGGKYEKKMEKLTGKYDVGKIGERKVGKGVNFYSLDREMQLGRELAREVQMGVRLVQDPVLNEYVNRLAQNLARNSDAKVPFNVRVVDSEEVNAFALPGGYFFVNTGLILAADNEAELAGVMAHEIAHVAARHATHNMTRRNIVALCTLPTFFVGGPVVMAVREATEAALPLQFLKFSRDAEREADLLGMQYMYASGYDPAAMVNFFERIAAKEKKKGAVARAFATHPMTAERVQRAQAEMATMLPSKGAYEVSGSEFDEVKGRLGHLQRNHLVAWVAPDHHPTLRRASEEGEKSTGKPTLKRAGE